MSLLDGLLARPAAWLAEGPLPNIVVSSRIRLARNLAATAFPGWAGDDERNRVYQALVAVLRGLPSLQPCRVMDLDALTPLDKELLRERRLISTELLQKGRGSGLVVREDEGLCAMVNEEDHLRLQALRPGLQLEALWQAIDRLDTEIEQQVDYAFSATRGYLTACPTNVGTGLRASVMIHAPGLRLTKDMEPIVKGLNRIGLTVRGLLGEGTEATGNMFQVSNQVTLGESEPVIIQRLLQVVRELETHEVNARARLLARRLPLVRDFVGRAYGVLLYAETLGSQEALDLISALQLGLEIGMIKGLEIKELKRLMLWSQPGHLQRQQGRTLTPEERDQIRAHTVREVIRQARRA
jgi:protein arginine kinase